MQNRMTSEEAIRIARADSCSDHDGSLLQTALLVTRNDRQIWVDSESAIGNVYVVEVDDQTGTVLFKGRVGLR